MYRIEITGSGEKVRIHIIDPDNKDGRWIELDPEQAIDVANKMIALAKSVGHGGSTDTLQ